jgi:hypothetical protein
VGCKNVKKSKKFAFQKFVYLCTKKDTQMTDWKKKAMDYSQENKVLNKWRKKSKTD